MPLCTLQTRLDPFADQCISVLPIMPLYFHSLPITDAWMPEIIFLLSSHHACTLVWGLARVPVWQWLLARTPVRRWRLFFHVPAWSWWWWARLACKSGWGCPWRSSTPTSWRCSTWASSLWSSSLVDMPTRSGSRGSLPQMPCSHYCRRTRTMGRHRPSGGCGRQHLLCDNFFNGAWNVGLFFVYVHATPGYCPHFPSGVGICLLLSPCALQGKMRRDEEEDL